MRKLFLIINFFFIGLVVSYAQLVTSSSSNIELASLISGGDVQLNNIQSNFATIAGSPQIGSFNGVSSNLGIDSGIVLATHFIGQVAGVQEGMQLPPNSGVDIDLSQILSNLSFPTTLAGVVSFEFDFIAPSDNLSFNYVYGSNEYSTGTCSNSQDVFGIFISGPGINGPFSNGAENIAMVPNPSNPNLYTNTPVLVNSINGGISTIPNQNPYGCNAVDPNWQDYSVFYQDNDIVDPTVNLAGFTYPIQAFISDLVPCETYHIKFAIAVGPDSGPLDGSALFVEANTFSNSLTSTSNTVEYQTNVSNYFSSDSPYQNNIYEGCGDAILSFYRPELAEGNITFTFRPRSEDGDAVIAVDYNLAGVNIINGNGYSTILLPEGQNETQLIISPIYDWLDELPEIIYIDIDQINLGCVQIEPDTIIFNLHDQPELNVDMVDDYSIYCPGSEIILEPIVSGGVGGLMSPPFNVDPYDYVWSHIGTAPIQTVYPEVTTEYCVTVTDICGTQVQSNCVKITVPEYEDLDANIYPTYICEDINENLCVLDVEGGEGNYSYLWSNGSMDSCIYDSYGEYEVTIFDACEKELLLSSEIYFDQAPDPYFEYISIPHINLGTEFTNYTDHSPNLSYIWNFGDGNYSNYIDPFHVFNTSGEYNVSLRVITSIAQCEKEYQSYVYVEPNYSLFVPNAFTPNDDGVNDLFRAHVKGLDKFEIFLYDSFGKMVFHSNDSKETWDGTYEGNPLAQGVYTYKVVMVKESDIVVFSQEGIVSLIR